MKTGIFFGIDTSNYTTSAAAVSCSGEVFCAKRVLSVPQGERGVRQSQALFCHTRDLPEVVEEVLLQVKEKYGSYELLALGASSQPRRVEGSYMPCFLAGVNAGKVAADLARAPFYSFSHQEGHVEAAWQGAKTLGKSLDKKEFYAFHISGGTTEFLSVREEEGRYQAELLAEALDLTLGQFIDRCGVKLGLSFPAGAHLEELALKTTLPKLPKIPLKEGGVNLSGFENQFDKKMAEGETKEALAAFVFAVVISAIKTLLSTGEEEKKVLFSGGVASSKILREYFSGKRYFFAPPAYSADNAIGIAFLTKKGYENG